MERWIAAKYIRDDSSVLDFKDLYEVSDQGNVRSLDYHRNGKTRALKQYTHEGKDGNISYYVCLIKGSKKYTIQVHRLVLSSFKPKGFRSGYIVNHKIERTSTTCINTLLNLEWVTPSQNTSTEHFKTLQSKVQKNHPAKSKRVCVTDLSTGEITEYPSATEVERALGLKHNSVSSCINYGNGTYKKCKLKFSYMI